MGSFDDLERHLEHVPADILRAVAKIDEGRGGQQGFKTQHPMVLKALKQVALVQSVEASNAIEDIHIPDKRLREIALDKVAPESRSEAEIAGYRRALAEIHENGENIPLTNNVVLQLHGWLYTFLPDYRAAGKWKTTDNAVTEKRPDGTEVIRFQPVAMTDTPRYMDALQLGFEKAMADDRYHPLLLIGTYVSDFLVIHPFQDGNGRMSRLITSLLLAQDRYEVGRYVSWEKLISETQDTYYEALQRSTAGWHDGTHDLHPWLSYFLGVLVASYHEFETRAKLGTGPGTRKALVENFVRNNLSDSFTVAEVRAIIPNTSDVQVGRILRDLKDRNIIKRRGAGSKSDWIRLKTDW